MRAKWIAVVVVLVILAGGWYLWRGRGGTSEPVGGLVDAAVRAPVAPVVPTTPAPSTPGGAPALPEGSRRPAPGGGMFEPGVLAKIPDAYTLTTASSGHKAVSLAGGDATAYGFVDAERGKRRLHGRVVDRAGMPVAGAIVLVDKNDRFVIAGRNLMSTTGIATDASGTFEITDGPETGFALAMDAHRGWSAVTPLAETMTLSLLGHGALHGRLRYAGHAERFSIQLQGDRFMVLYESDPDGQFTIASLPPGAYKLAVGLAQVIGGGASKQIQRDVTITADQTTEVDIEQASGTTIAIVAAATGASTFECWLFLGSSAPADVAAAKARGKTEKVPYYLLGGQDVTGHLEFHDVTAGLYTACCATPAAFGCASFPIADTEQVHEVALDLAPLLDRDR